MKKLMEDIIYVGVDDHDTDLFERQYPVPEGISYNSYVIKDEKTAVMDTVDVKKTGEWMANLEQALDGRVPDYLVVQHMEPDHSASLAAFVKKYPTATVVGNTRTFGLISQFFRDLELPHKLEVKEGELLCLGKHTLKFMFAPMVHWPEVMMTYETYGKILFSADAFGRFGALDADISWEEEAGRYYIGIVGKYGAQVQSVLRKLAGEELNMICPLHGPVLKENLKEALELYDIWSGYRAGRKGVCICFSSVYGHTEEAVLLLGQMLREAGAEVICHDLSKSDWSRAVADAFFYDMLVLASITYNGDVFPQMKTFLEALTERNYQNRRVALIENGSWAPAANKIMMSYAEKWKNVIVAENKVTVRSAMDSTAVSQIEILAGELCRQE